VEVNKSMSTVQKLERGMGSTLAEKVLSSDFGRRMIEKVADGAIVALLRGRELKFDITNDLSLGKSANGERTLRIHTKGSAAITPIGKVIK